MEIVLLFILIVFNGVFAMSEIALVTARRARLSARAAEGNKGAQAALRLGDDPARFLSAIQIGITSIGLFSGIVGESAFAGPLSLWMQEAFGLPAATAETVSTIAVVALVTYLSIVIGELVPKRLGQLAPEAVACLVARPMNALAAISRPFVALLTFSTSVLLRVLGVRGGKEQAVTEEEIQAMIDEGSEAGTIERKQREMLTNIFRLDDRTVSSIMVPRSEIRFLDIERSLEENLEILREYRHSWLPLCRGGLRELLGVVRTQQALLLFACPAADGESFTRRIEALAHPAEFVPEAVSSLDLLKLFQKKGMHTVFIVDEYGTLQGLVTLRDILEILAGQIGAPHEDSWAVQREDGSWLIDGSIPLPELKDLLGIRRLPDENEGHYSILSGMLMYLEGRIPAEGDSLSCCGWIFEVVDMDGNRIDKVLVRREGPPRS